MNIKKIPLSLIILKKDWFFLLSFVVACAANILGAKYYRLLEKERKLFLGLRGIDSLAGYEYLNLPSSTERKYFYDQYWQGKNEEREQFGKRAEYAFKEFGKYAPLEDMRLPIYMRYGEPTRRYVITPEKKIGIVTKEFVRPAEIWTYKARGIEFDFVKIDRAYRIIAQTTFGDSVSIPYLRKEKDSIISLPPEANFINNLKLDIGTGRFRQAKNLTRLEIYARLFIEEPMACSLIRWIRIQNEADSLVAEKINKLTPSETEAEIFFDEINFWLPPAKYKVLIEYFNLKKLAKNKQEIIINLIEYKEDAKKVSDLVFAQLIDNSYTDEKFEKPSIRVIPLIEPKIPVGQPFYLYHEIYNLSTDNGMHSLKTIYEIYNREKMRKEIVDVLVQSEINEGDAAYLGAKYHPMDLPEGQYIIVAKTTDMLSGEEFSAVGEFILEKKKK